MIKLGVNSVLFKTVPFADACRYIKRAGYDGVEICAIESMNPHLDLDNWRDQVQYIKDCVKRNNLEILSSEVASRDMGRIIKACQAANEIGIPILNIGPGGVMDDEQSVLDSIELTYALAQKAKEYGVTLCCKAHVNSAIYNTPTTLKMMEGITCDAFGVDMDPSHIHRAGENPAEALPQVISRVKHVHIRDCVGPGPSPGEPMNQACGRGEIDLYGYFKAMVDVNYNGPVCLEVIGPEQDPINAMAIAAESYGYMNALLKALNAR